MAENNFSSEEYLEKLKEKEIEKQREEEKQRELERNSYLKDKLISEILEEKKPNEKEFSSEEFFERLKDKKIKEEEI
jgi:hypothetical protein